MVPDTGVGAPHRDPPLTCKNFDVYHENEVTKPVNILASKPLMCDSFLMDAILGNIHYVQDMVVQHKLKDPVQIRHK